MQEKLNKIEKLDLTMKPVIYNFTEEETKELRKEFQEWNDFCNYLNRNLKYED